MISVARAPTTVTGALIDPSMLLHDPSFDDLVEEAFTRLDTAPHRIRSGPEFEEMLVAAEPLHRTPTDERSLLSVNYTSGTSGRPKGVMYHHRGASLQSVAMVGHTGLTPYSLHLWTLPMFRCNGWSRRRSGWAHARCAREDRAERRRHPTTSPWSLRRV